MKIYEAEKTIAKHLFESGPYDYRANRDDAACIDHEP